jgi:RHS repeat-associated protein
MIHKVVDDQINSLIWDGFTIIQSLTHSQTHTLTNSFIWGLDLSGSLQGFGGVGGLLAEVHDGTPYFAAFDANGNVTEYVSTNGTLVAHYEYSPFGEIVVQSGDMADAFTHRFSTKPWCSVTSLSEYEFRMYCPGMGRWASRDPIGERAGLLLYNICRNNGIGSVDTLGLATIRWPPPGEISSPPIGMILPPDVTFPSISPPLEDLIDPDLPQLPPINSETYAVKKCEIVIFYGHGWIEFFKGVSVDKCGGTTAVTCKSNVIFTYLAGLIPDAVGTDIDVDFGAPSPGKDFAGHLYRPNVAAMKMYAEKLKKPHCCCPDVKLKAKCLGTFMECNSGPWTIKTGWFAPPAGIP